MSQPPRENLLPASIPGAFSAQLQSAKDEAAATELRVARERLVLREQEVELKEGLPFLHGWKWYPWAREFYESQNKINLLCAANQISKSSTQIRKCINWATDQQMWPRLWSQKPIQFWYLYPTGDQAAIEFETKWKQFLPKGRFKEDPVYGWKEEWKQKKLFAIHFNSGVHVYFKTYAQDAQALQTGTCDAIFCDEELPTDLYNELIFRVSASDGYFHMVFTATLGQEFWRLAMEPGPREEETLVGAKKLTVSMYDCLVYEDGTLSHWTHEKIQVVKGRCKTHNEVLRRVYGHFVTDEGRKYESFDMKRHMVDSVPIPKDWLIYGGVDVGSGGQNGHRSAIVFVAVRPDFRKGYAFIGWRSEGEDTTAGDVVAKFMNMKKEHHLFPTAQYYDWGCKDFQTIATRMGEPFLPADKSHERGEQVINVLFKNDMLHVFDTRELQKLGGELATLRRDTPKTKAKDDIADGFRYAVTRIPWDWSAITGAHPEGYEPPGPKLSRAAQEIQERRSAFEHRREEARIEDEFAEWNDLYG